MIRTLATVTLGLVTLVGTARADAFAWRELRFDAYVFSQEDHGGQPLKAEGVTYLGLRPAATVDLSESVTFRINSAIALLLNDDPEAFDTINGATVTSASSEVIAWDMSAGLRIQTPGSAWTFLPGLYYHHQVGYVAEGIDLGVEREFSGGDTILSITFNLRAAFPLQKFWDGRHLGRDQAITNNLALGVRQHLSPALLVSGSVQYTRGDGKLGNALNYVVFYNGTEALALGDETLPSTRNRWQFSARVRYSPTVGVAIGLDNSRYTDDWGIDHVAVEPSLATPLGGGTSGRFWYRWSDQTGTKYFDATPAFTKPFVTQDSDLATFTMHSAGAAFAVPMGPGWELRTSVFGFDRGDGIRALGTDVGTIRRW